MRASLTLSTIRVWVPTQLSSHICKPICISICVVVSEYDCVLRPVNCITYAYVLVRTKRT